MFDDKETVATSRNLFDKRTVDINLFFTMIDKTVFPPDVTHVERENPWQPREPQTAKRARMPQQREIHQSELVLPFKNLLAHGETLNPHQRAPTPE